MGARSSGREAALQMLFAIEGAGHSSTEVIRHFWLEMPGEVEGRSYADPLLSETCLKKDELDEHIRKAASNWRLERMTPVDRNILRLGACELIFHPDIPMEVIIDEAVELAKRYSGDKSPRFVNGVLDKLAQTVRRASPSNAPG